MTSQARRTSPPGPSQQPRVRDDRDAFAKMFDAHAQHAFDYCCSLLGDRARATSATQVTLIAAHSLAGRLKDEGRMRAFVLALGRRECLSGGQGLAGTAEPDATRPDGSDDADARDLTPADCEAPDCEAPTALSLRAILQALPGQDREILDLLYRHDVSTADLAPLLGVPASSVPGMLAAAKSKFAARASETAHPAAAGPASPDMRAEQLSAVRLASLPDSVRRRTARVVMDPGFPCYREAVRAHAEHLGPDGFPVQAATPSTRKLLLASALMAGLLLAPAAAGGAVYAALSTPAHVVEHHHSPAVTRHSLPRSHGSPRPAPAKHGSSDRRRLAAAPRG